MVGECMWRHVQGASMMGTSEMTSDTGKASTPLVRSLESSDSIMDWLMGVRVCQAKTTTSMTANGSRMSGQEGHSVCGTRSRRVTQVQYWRVSCVLSDFTRLTNQVTF